MTVATVCEQLHQQIDNLPDNVVQQIADFALFILARWRVSSDYVDWDGNE